MNNFKVGFSRNVITPKMGIDISGYFVKRTADGVLDELFANAIAFECGDSRAVMICVDNLGIKQGILKRYRERLADENALPVESVFISCTHTHTGPSAKEGTYPEVDEYLAYLSDKLSEVAKDALADLKDAKMGFGVGQAPDIAFVRRFRMKDGSIKTNPGVNNPDIAAVYKAGVSSFIYFCEIRVKSSIYISRKTLRL